ncbi:aldo/keto reductase [Bradyrhizobium sp. SZCCHNRI1009]|uniref:aldo/keto reductase n=1 Tax=Bradyrhizobium sp. SZCCHNRI1009 TaxID=3057277 RepID=UPI002916EE6F|nr:aldo/keto reductase [Bradyrhizobium sp. SZCCHNRI1009]
MGVTHFDTAELYGPFVNEELLADALGFHRARVEVATKFGYRLEAGKIVGLDSRPQSIRSAVEGSLRRLRRDYDDVLYQHRPDPNVAVEEVVGTMSDLVKEGKVLGLGLSATDTETVQRASAVHRISFVQNEYSLIQREPEKGLLAYLNDQRIEFVCYSPLGRGILGRMTGGETKRSSTDHRAKDPRFESGRLAEINRALDPLWDVAAAHSVAPSAVALAWLLAKSPTIRVIPSATSIEQLKTNLGGVEIVLSSEEMASLDKLDKNLTTSTLQ